MVNYFQAELIQSVSTMSVRLLEGSVSVKTIILVQKDRTAHLERDLRRAVDWCWKCFDWFRHWLGGPRGYGETLDYTGARHRGHVDATPFTCGRSHTIRPWPGQGSHEGIIWVANETVPIRFWQNVRPDVHWSTRTPRRAATAIWKLLDVSRGCHLDG